MDKITEIIYLVSMRCNLNCRHCGQNQDVPKEQELDCARVLEQIENSLLLGDASIDVTGGEPFLNPGMGDLIIGLLRRTNHRVNITTNGYFTKEIAALADRLTPAEKQRLGFTISIDGLRDTHNAIRRNPLSFDRALESVKYLAGQNVTININTVVQAANLRELPEMERLFASISPKIHHNCIPFLPDLSSDARDEYTEEYARTVWQYAEDRVEWKKTILSHGKGKIRRCHAGQKNITIGPDGKVYPCVTGAYYTIDKKREEFLLGDLACQTLDEILADTTRREEVYTGAVTRCAGCASHCEAEREWFRFGAGGGYTAGRGPRGAAA